MSTMKNATTKLVSLSEGKPFGKQSEAKADSYQGTGKMKSGDEYVLVPKSSIKEDVGKDESTKVDVLPSPKIDAKLMKSFFSKGFKGSLRGMRHMHRSGNHLRVTLSILQTVACDVPGFGGANLYHDDVVSLAGFSDLLQIFDQCRLVSSVVTVGGSTAASFAGNTDPGLTAVANDVDNTGTSSLSAGNLVAYISQYPLSVGKDDSLNKMHLGTVSSHFAPMRVQIEFPHQEVSNSIVSSILYVQPGAWFNTQTSPTVKPSGEWIIAVMSGPFTSSNNILTVHREFVVDFRFRA